MPFPHPDELKERIKKWRNKWLKKHKFIAYSVLIFSAIFAIFEGFQVFTGMTPFEFFGGNKNSSSSTISVSIDEQKPLYSNLYASNGLWGPIRELYTLDKPADFPVFNSMIDNPLYGDERNFAKIKEVAAPTSAYADGILLVPGNLYEVRFFIHNNARSSGNEDGTSISKNTCIDIEFPSTVDGHSYGNIRIKSDNASPTEIWDSIGLNSNTEVKITFISNSAEYLTASKEDDESFSRRKIDDSIFNGYHLIGSSGFDGVFLGCSEHMVWIYFKFKVS